MELEIKNLTKKYNKNSFALNDFSITIKNGVLGLLGPNGAGKSTLLKTISTISKPTGGNVFLNGKDIVKSPNYMRKSLGYLPQDFGVYPNLNAYEFLTYVAALKGIGGKGLKYKITQLLEGVNLIGVAKKSISTYSGGMKQRLGIAQSLLNNPKVLILDEPTIGLDPEERIRFRNLISQIAKESIVILSSHIVSDIESLADSIAIMESGSLIAYDKAHEITKNLPTNIYEALITQNNLYDFEKNNLVVSVVRKDSHLLVRYISNQPIEKSTHCKATLEDAYLYYTKQNTNLIKTA